MFQSMKYLFFLIQFRHDFNYPPKIAWCIISLWHTEVDPNSQSVAYCLIIEKIRFNSEIFVSYAQNIIEFETLDRF